MTICMLHHCLLVCARSCLGLRTSANVINIVKAASTDVSAGQHHIDSKYFIHCGSLPRGSWGCGTILCFMQWLNPPECPKPESGQAKKTHKERLQPCRRFKGKEVGSPTFL